MSGEAEAMKLEEVAVLEGHRDRVWCVAWSPSGEELASCSGDRTVRLWRRGADGAWTCSAVLEEAHTRTIRCVAWSPSGRHLATASFDATTAIWEVQAGLWEQVAVLEGHENEVKCVAWSPCGTKLATCGRDRSVWIWEALPGNEFECLDVKQGHSQDVKVVCWSRTGEVLASGSYDNTIKLWCDDGEEWVCLQTLSGHSSTVWSLSFSTTGNELASASDDGDIRVWRVHQLRGKWCLAYNISGYHTRTVYSVDWSLHNLLASGCGDNGIRVFSIVEVGSLPNRPCAESSRVYHTASRIGDYEVNCVAWCSLMPVIFASCGDDMIVRIWKVANV